MVVRADSPIRARDRLLRLGARATDAPDELRSRLPTVFDRADATMSAR